MSAKWFDTGKNLKISKSRWVFFLLIALFALRIFHLDSDVPNLNVAQYMPLDEGYYAMQAFQLVHPEEMEAVAQIDSGTYTQWNSAVSFLTTLFCTLTLSVFGDNYYGLRMSVVLAGFLVFIMMLSLVWQQEKKRQENMPVSAAQEADSWKALLLFGMIAVCNFAFSLACRIVEPSMFRMLGTMVMIFVFYQCYQKQKDGYFLLGVFSVLSVIWGYSTNLFVFVPCGVLLVLELIWKTGTFWKNLGKYIVGCISAYLAGEALMYLVQRRFFWQDFLRVVMGRESGRVSFSLVDLKDCTKAYFSGNLYVYGGAVLLTLGVAAVLYCLITGWMQRDRFRMFLSMLVMGHTAQSMLTNDFAWRKSIVIFPFVLLNLYILYADRAGIREWLGKQKASVKKGICLALALLACAETIVICLRVKDMTELDMTIGFRHFFIAATVIILLLFLFWLFCEKKWRLSFTWGIIIVPMLFLNLVCGYIYIGQADMTEKQIMLELDEIVGEDYVLGGFPYSYCLYNEVIPASGVYDAYLGEAYENRVQELLESEEVRYYLGYPMDAYMGEVLEVQYGSWTELRRFDRNYATSSEDDQIVLYEWVKN